AFASEFFCCLAWALDGKQRYPHQSFEAAWKLLALNQFHDILPGSSIKEVYETTIPQLAQIATTFDEAASQARSFLVSNIAKAAEDVVVFNTLDFVRNDLCTIEAASYCSIHDETGRRLPSCKQGSKLHFIACKVPSKGWKRYRLGNEHADSEIPFSWEEPKLSTPYYEATFAGDGSLARLYDKQQRREVLAQGKHGNVFSLSVDLPKEYDAWNIGKQGALMQYALDSEVRYHVLSCSEVGITLEGTWTWLKSTYRQRITFGAHSKRIDFNLHVDWREDHLMLRTAFTVDVRSPRASYDIAYGVCERSTHTNTSWDEVQFEVPAHKWVDLSEKT
ncbi:MAG: alpha-mannosidase, partial [Spirochaetia bacterium]|nr:alpha-mannosidase [Spirochaetia bacterium]